MSVADIEVPQKVEPTVGKSVWYIAQRSTGSTPEMGASINAAIITAVKREGFYSTPVEGWLVDLAVLSPTGLLFLHDVSFGATLTYGRWSWVNTKYEEEEMTWL